MINRDAVYKVRVDKRGASRLVDTIFKGKVKRLAKGMEGIFVDIGLERDAFLPLKGENYKVGEGLIVQLVREPEQEKGAKLTTNVKLVGKYLVYFPRGRDVKCSSKVTAEEREKLCSLIENELKEEGVILRSSACGTEPELIKQELQKLRELWQWVQKRAKVLKKPQPILEEYPSYIRLIRDNWRDLEEIVCDDAVLWNYITSFLEEFEPSMLRKNLYIKDLAHYIHRYKLYESLRSIFSKVVWLRSGGYIVIEEAEACTVIDVNSGDPTGSCHEENALKTNLEAVEEIAKQIILRDIGGIILVDFIDMKKQESKNCVINALQSAFGEEACGITIYGFTRLGILEMVRKKTGKSISRSLSEECPICSGRGYMKSNAMLLLEIEKELINSGHRVAEVCVHPLRYERMREALPSSLQVRQSHEVSVNDYSISYA